MTRALLALALVAWGCSGPRVATATRGVRSAPVTSPAPSTRPASAQWTRVAPRHVPGRIDDVAALSDGQFVVLSGTSVLRLDPHGAVASACELDPNQEVHGLYASTGGWWAVAGDEAAPTFWRGDATSAPCRRSTLPPLIARDAPAGRLLAARAGDEALVWSSAGAMLRSRDGGRTWERIPPLPETIAVTVSGGTLYAAALLGGPSTRSPTGSTSYALFSLGDTDEHWISWETPSDRTTPVVLLPRAGGGVIGVDVLGRFEAGRPGVPSTTEVSGPIFVRDRPALLVSAGDVVVGLGRDLVFEHRDGRWRPLPPLPDCRHVTAIDARSDGSLGVTDGHQLWQVRPGADPELVLSSPFGGRFPQRIAASGAVIAVVSSDVALTVRRERAMREGVLAGRVVSPGERLSVTRDGGETWRTEALPGDAAGDVTRGLTVLPDGVVALVTGRLESNTPVASLWLSDTSLRRVDLPAGARVFEPTGASLHAVGDRWLLLAGEVFVSDDLGVRWRRTLGAPPGADPHWSVLALATSTDREVFALDAAGVLWRSDDAGDEFVAMPGTAPGPVASNAGPNTGAWLSWDGGPSLRGSRHGQLWRYERDGRSESVASMRSASFGALVGDALVVAAPGHWRECRRGDDRVPLLLAIWPQHPPAPIADACNHIGAAYARDGDALYVATADGTIERASLAGLLREAVELNP